MKKFPILLLCFLSMYSGYPYLLRYLGIDRLKQMIGHIKHGNLYPGPIIDLFSRFVVGLSESRPLGTLFQLTTLNGAVRSMANNVLIKNIICILSLSFVIYSCNVIKDNESQLHYIRNINSIIIKGENINIPGVYEPTGILAIDTLLVVISPNNDYFFHIYDIKTFNLIKKFGTKGRGPGQFIAPVFTGQKMARTPDGVNLLIYDWMRKRISNIKLLDELTIPGYKVQSELLPKQMINVSNIIFRNDSIALYIPYDEESPGRFCIYNFKSGERTFTPYVPDLGFKIHPNNLNAIYNTHSSCVNARRHCFVATPCLLGELDFFDMSCNYLGSSIIERSDEVKNAHYSKMIFETPNISYYFTDLQCYDDRIYALYTIKKYPNLDNETNSEIYVINWNGNPIKKYILDREISNFTYDSTNNRFIGYSHRLEDAQSPFVKFELK